VQDVCIHMAMTSLSRLFSSSVAIFRGRLHAFLGNQFPLPDNFTPRHISEFSLKQRTIATYLSFYFCHSRKLPHFSSSVLIVSCATNYVASSNLGYRVSTVFIAFYVPHRFELEILSQDLFIAV